MNLFISSTYVDLAEYRREIWNLLKSFKVNVNGMEKFGARKETSLETCINEVNQSDIFIAIIGMRYGSTDKTTGKSITQLEYEQAVKNNEEIIIYLINEQDSTLHPNQIDFENFRKLQEFKKTLKENHNVDFFKDSDELIRKLNIRLLQLLPSAKKNK